MRRRIRAVVKNLKFRSLSDFPEIYAEKPGKLLTQVFYMEPPVVAGVSRKKPLGFKGLFCTSSCLRSSYFSQKRMVPFSARLICRSYGSLIRIGSWCPPVSLMARSSQSVR